MRGGRYWKGLSLGSRRARRAGRLGAAAAPGAHPVRRQGGTQPAWGRSSLPAPLPSGPCSSSHAPSTLPPPMSRRHPQHIPPPAQPEGDGRRLTPGPPCPPAPLRPNPGVYLDKNLMKIAGNALKANITTLGPLVLPLSEQLLFFANLVARKVGGIASQMAGPRRAGGSCIRPRRAPPHSLSSRRGEAGRQGARGGARGQLHLARGLFGCPGAGLLRRQRCHCGTGASLARGSHRCISVHTWRSALGVRHSIRPPPPSLPPSHALPPSFHLSTHPYFD